MDWISVVLEATHEARSRALDGHHVSSKSPSRVHKRERQGNCWKEPQPSLKEHKKTKFSQKSKLKNIELVARPGFFTVPGRGLQETSHETGLPHQGPASKAASTFQQEAEAFERLAFSRRQSESSAHGGKQLNLARKYFRIHMCMKNIELT